MQAVLPEIEKKQIMCTPFPMIKDKEKLTISHNKIYSDIVSELEAGKKCGNAYNRRSKRVFDIYVYP